MSLHFLLALAAAASATRTTAVLRSVSVIPRKISWVLTRVVMISTVSIPDRMVVATESLAGRLRRTISVKHTTRFASGIRAARVAAFALRRAGISSAPTTTAYVSTMPSSSAISNRPAARFG